VWRRKPLQKESGGPCWGDGADQWYRKAEKERDLRTCETETHQGDTEGQPEEGERGGDPDNSRQAASGLEDYEGRGGGEPRVVQLPGQKKKSGA